MERKNYQITVTLLWIGLLLMACNKEKPITQLPIDNGSKKALVLCEGSLGNGNASLTQYDIDSQQVIEDVFSAMNQQPMGDILQSITPIGNQLFLCVNNSDKLLVINKKTYALEGILSIPKPRYILPINESKAYVSTLFSNKVYIINPKALTIDGSFELPTKNAENMLLWNGEAILCSWDTSNNKIYFIDTATNKIEKSLDLPAKAPQECLLDKEGKLWVLSGDAYNKIDVTFLQLEPTTGNVLKTFKFPAATEVIKPILNQTKDSLYFIEVQYDGSPTNNGIYRMNVQASSLPSQPFIAAQSFQYFWGLGIEPSSGSIWVGDPKGFTQKGVVSIYQPNGDKVKEFKTGVGPSRFYFK